MTVDYINEEYYQNQGPHFRGDRHRLNSGRSKGMFPSLVSGQSSQKQLNSNGDDLNSGGDMSDRKRLAQSLAVNRKNNETLVNKVVTTNTNVV